MKDRHVWKLAQKFTNVSDLRTLALNGLDLEGYTIDATMYNNDKAIQEASYKVLQTWVQSQADMQIAYTNLVTALKKSGFEQMATELQESVQSSAS